jgi:ubiquinone/menaquinone biosynthesis C-methylase UbiE
MATATPPMIEQFKEMVRQEWTDDANVAAWSKWKAPIAVQTQAMTDAIIVAADVAPGLQVLDIAGGTGELGLTLASAVGPTGHVTETDLGPGMLAVGEEQARARGLTNLTFRQADAHVLPFADASFDRVTCRFGVMYFADAPTALREIRRVLKPGGRAAFVAWGPLAENTFFLTCVGPFFKRVAPPPAPPGAPTPFKYAAADTLAGQLRDASFMRITEETRTMPLPWPGPPEELLQYFRDTAAPFRPLIDEMPDAERAAAINEVLAGARSFYDGERIKMSASVIVASAMR